MTTSENPSESHFNVDYEISRANSAVMIIEEVASSQQIASPSQLLSSVQVASSLAAVSPRESRHKRNQSNKMKQIYEYINQNLHIIAAAQQTKREAEALRRVQTPKRHFTLVKKATEPVFKFTDLKLSKQASNQQPGSRNRPETQNTTESKRPRGNVS